MFKKSISIIIIIALIIGLIPTGFSYDFGDGTKVLNIVYTREHSGYDTTGAYIEITGSSLNNALILFGKSGQSGGLVDMGEKVFNFSNFVKYVFDDEEAKSFSGVIMINGVYFDLGLSGFPNITSANQKSINIDEGDDLTVIGNNFDKIDGTIIKGEYGNAQTTQIIDGPLINITTNSITFTDPMPPGEMGYQNINFTKDSTLDYDDPLPGDISIKVNYVYANAFRFIENLGLIDPLMYPNTGAKGDSVFITADNFTDSKNYAVYFLKDLEGADDFSDLNKGTYVSLALNVDGTTSDKLTVKVPTATLFELRNYYLVIADTVNGEIISTQTIMDQNGDPAQFTVVGTSFVPTIENIYPTTGPDTGAPVQVQGRNLISLNIPDLSVSGTNISIDSYTPGDDRKIQITYENGTYKGNNVTVQRNMTVQIGKNAFFQRDELNNFKYLKSTPDSIFLVTDIIDDAETDPYKDVVIELETVLTETVSGKAYTFRQFVSKQDAYRFSASSLTPIVDKIVPGIIQVEGAQNNLKESLILSITGSKFLVNRYTDILGITHINYPSILIKSTNDLSPESYDIKLDFNATELGIKGVAYDKDDVVTDEFGDPVSITLEVLSGSTTIDGTEGNEEGTKVLVRIPKEIELNQLGIKHLQVINPKRSSDDDGKSAIKLDSLDFVQTIDVPVIETVTPNIVTVDGNVEIQVKGYNFQQGAKIYLDGDEITSYTREIDIEGNKLILKFKAPAGREGTKQLQIMNPSGGIAVADFYYVSSFNKDPIFTSFSPTVGTYDSIVVVNGDNYLKPDPTALNKTGIGALRLIGSRIFLDGKDVNEYNYNSNGDNEFIPYTVPNEEMLFSQTGGKIYLSNYSENIRILDNNGKVYFLENDSDLNPVLSDHEGIEYTIKWDKINLRYRAYDGDGNEVTIEDNGDEDYLDSDGIYLSGSNTVLEIDSKVITVYMDNSILSTKKSLDNKDILVIANYVPSVIFEDTAGIFYTLEKTIAGEIRLTNGRENSYTIYESLGTLKAQKDVGGLYDVTLTDTGLIIGETPVITLNMSTVYKFDSGDLHIYGDRTRIVSKEQIIFSVPILTTGKGYKDIKVVNPDTKFAQKTGTTGFYYIASTSTHPVISEIIPNKGSVDGGYTVTIYGSEFESDVQVFFDGVLVPQIDTSVSLDGTEIRVEVPKSIKDLAADFGVDRMHVPVITLNKDGGSAFKEKGFMYVIPSSSPKIERIIPLTGSANGGEIVEIIGYEFRYYEPYVDKVGTPEYEVGDDFEDLYPNNSWDDLLNEFDPGAISQEPLDTNPLYTTYYKSPLLPKVYFGNKEAKVVEYAKGYLKVITPTNIGGSTDVYVLNNDSGTSNIVKYTYTVSAPKITSINPNQGSFNGLENRDIYGSEFYKSSALGYQNDIDDSVVMLDNLESMVRFGDLTNKAIDRYLPNGGLINNERATVALSGELTVAYQGDNNSLTMSIQANGSVYQRTFTNYEDQSVFLPLEMLKSGSLYYRPSSFEDDDATVYDDYIFEYVKVYIEDRRLIVERGYAPYAKYDSKSHVAIKTPNYYTIGVVNAYLFNPDGGSVKTSFTFTNPASKPRIFDIKPKVFDAVNNKWLTEATYKGGIQLEIKGQDLRNGLKAYIGTKEAKIIDITTALENIDGVDINLDVLILEVPATVETDVNKEYPIILINTDGGVVNSTDLTKLMGEDNDYPYYFIYRKPLSGPTITSVIPSSTSVYGGNTVTIKGKDFRGGASVIIGSIGGVPVTNTTVLDRGETLTFVTPTYLTLGLKDIQVINPDFGTGTLKGSLKIVSYPTVEDSVYSSDGTSVIDYVSVEGGQIITLKGDDFQTGAKVVFGGTRQLRSETTITGSEGLFRDDKKYVITKGNEAKLVEYVDENTLKVTTPTINAEDELIITVINPDTGISDSVLTIQYKVPIPNAPTGLKAQVVDDRYIKIYEYTTNVFDYYEIYYVLSTKTQAQLVANNYKDFKYLTTTDIEPYKITKLPEIENLYYGQSLHLVIKAVNKFGPSNYSNIATLDYNALVNIERIGPPDSDSPIGTIIGDYKNNDLTGTIDTYLSSSLVNTKLIIDLSQNSIDKYRNIFVPYSLIKTNTTTLAIGYGDMNVLLMPINFNTSTINKVAYDKYPYGQLSLDLRSTPDDSEKINLIPRGLKAYSGLVDINFYARSNTQNLLMPSSNGYISTTIKINDLTNYTNVKSTLSLYKFDPISRTWVKFSSKLDDMNKSIGSSINQSGTYVILGNR